MNTNHEYRKNQYCCKECKNQYMREWRAKHPIKSSQYVYKYQQARRGVVDQYKLDHGCADCGYNKLPYVLSFDHVRGEKLFAISKSLSGTNIQKILEEIKKCDVVCHNCHSIRTYSRNQQGRKYGINDPSR